MRHIPLLLVLLTVAAPAFAETKANDPKISPSAPGGLQLPGQITDARLDPAHWYNNEQLSAGFQVGGSGPECTAQAVFARKEDGAQTTVFFGTIQLPWEGRAMVGDPLGLGPGTYDVTVKGVAGVSRACGGQASVGKVVADEALLGRSFPKITGAAWVGGDRWKSGSKEDKFLEVNVVNYLDGSRWTKPTAWHPNPVCAVTINSNYSFKDIDGHIREMNVNWKDPYALVLAGNGAVPAGSQVVTPGAGGGKWKANITESIRHYQAPSSGQIWTITIASTPTNNGQGESPCIGTTVAHLFVD